VVQNEPRLYCHLAISLRFTELEGTPLVIKPFRLLPFFTLPLAAILVMFLALASIPTADDGPIEPDGELLIMDVLLEHPDYPTQEWKEVPLEGTIDGSRLRMTVFIRNMTDELRQAEVSFLDADTREPLPGGIISGSVFPPGAELPVDYTWDTTGLAWDEGEPRSERSIEIRVTGLTGVHDRTFEEVIVRPRPVILVHGINSDANTWRLYDGFLSAAHPRWRGHAIDTMNTGSLSFSAPVLQTNSIAQNAALLATYIETLRADQDAWHVDIVAHSLGGLITREYIQEIMPPSIDEKPVVGNLVMLGTPNRGSFCAALAAATIGATPEDALDPARRRALIALYELTPYATSLFNERVIDQRGVPFSILAGVPYNIFMWCGVPAGDNDGVVTSTSAFAHFTGARQATTGSNHIEMTLSQEDFNSFVKPILAADAVAQRAAAVEQEPGADAHGQIIFARAVELPAQDGVSIPLALSQETALRVMVMGPPEVEARLVSPGGEVEQTIPAHSEEALQHFRALSATLPTAGVWSLRLDNHDSSSGQVLVAAMVEGTPLTIEVTLLEATGEKEIVVAASLRDAHSPILGATVQATVASADGSWLTIPLFDDGKHGDGAAGDGIYGGRTPPLEEAGYTVVVESESGGATRLVVEMIDLSASDDMLPPVWLPLIAR
jgi:large repetitive protein